MSAPFEDPTHRRPQGTPSPFPSWERRRAEAEALLRWADLVDAQRAEDDPDR